MNGNNPKCPKCGAPMEIKTARKGKNAGGQFYGCTAYFRTGCHGTLPIDSNLQNSKIHNEVDKEEIVNESDSTHYVPVQLNARSLYKDFSVSFVQSLAVPFDLIDKINKEELDISEFRRQSQWRMDYKFSDRTILESNMRDIYTLAKKLLTRGTVTISSENLEEELMKLFKTSSSQNLEFSIDSYQFHKIIISNNQQKFEDSYNEMHFYSEVLAKWLGPYYQDYVIPQIHLESLVKMEYHQDAYEQQRVDFLISNDKESIVIELDGEEHQLHKENDTFRDQLLDQAGYRVIRLKNNLATLDSLLDLDFDVPRINQSELNDYGKMAVSLKLSHQIQIAIINAILNGYDIEKYPEIAVAFSSQYIDHENAKRITGLIENELNILLANIFQLFGMEDNFFGLAIVPYDSKNHNDGLVISFSEEGIEENNVILIKDIRFNRIIANYLRSSRLRFYDYLAEENLEFFLSYLFRKESFREGQLETIRRGLQGKDCLVLLPTGAGKSIAFQLTSLLLNGITIVIDPILALIQDQIENLNRVGIDRIAGITSLISERKNMENTIKAFSNGEYIITFVAPERLQSFEFREAIEGLNTITPIPLVAIDEAHCVSEWGHDFRTSYLNIGRIAREYCGMSDKPPCIMGLTGTASNTVLRDVQRELGIQEFDSIITPKTFDRKELTYGIFKSNSEEKTSILKNLMTRYFPEIFSYPDYASFLQTKGEKTRCGLIFCPHVNGDFGVVNVAKGLVGLGSDVKVYSGEKPKIFTSSNWNQEKSKIARDFKNNKFPLLVTTKAFGMGIDKANINYTVHFGLPASIESFYQEAGRAGRNGDLSRCVILLSIDNPERAAMFLDPKKNISELQEINESVNFNNHDDISRIMFFHLNSFKGLDEELAVIAYVIDKIGDLEALRKVVIIRANDDFRRQDIEKALYRLIILGVVLDYTVNYSSNEITFVYNVTDKDQLIDRYALYVSGYSKSRVNKETSNIHSFFDLPYKEFLLQASKVLISFIYDTIEKGRRRGLAEMLGLSEAALRSDEPDEVIRKRVLQYFETTYSEEIERILNENELKYDYIKNLLDGFETSDGRILGGLRSPKDAEEIRGQVSRYLETYPEHPGLLMLRAISEIFSRDANKETVLFTFEAALQYSKEQIGYSINIEDFYKLVAWSLIKIGERDSNMYSEIVPDLLVQFADVQFAKQLIEFAEKEEFVYNPVSFIVKENCRDIKNILRRDII